MSMSHEQVAARWLSQPHRDRASGFSVYFVGPTIYSYGYHFPIASLIEGPRGERIALFTRRGYSVSTSKHKSIVSRQIYRAGLKMLQVTDPSSRNWRQFAAEARAEAKRLRASAARRRLEHRREWDLREAAREDEAAKLFAKLAKKGSNQ